MAGDAYTVYIIHPFVVDLLAIAVSGLALPALAKFAIGVFSPERGRCRHPTDGPGQSGFGSLQE